MLIFIHVPKTGGKSISEAIRHVAGEQRCCICDDQIDLERAAEAWPEGGLINLDYLAGHIRLPVIERILGTFQLDPNTTTIFSMLREPVERAFSYYLFVQRTPTMAHFREPVLDKDFDFFWDYFYENVYWTLRDPHCFLICGERSAAAAKHAIEEKKILIGTLDRFSAFYEVLRTLVDFVNLPLIIPSVNVAPVGMDVNSGMKPPNWREYVSEKTVRKIREQNAADYELWEYVRFRNSGLISHS